VIHGGFESTKESHPSPDFLSFPSFSKQKQYRVTKSHTGYSTKRPYVHFKLLAMPVIINPSREAEITAETPALRQDPVAINEKESVKKERSVKKENVPGNPEFATSSLDATEKGAPPQKEESVAAAMENLSLDGQGGVQAADDNGKENAIDKEEDSDEGPAVEIPFVVGRTPRPYGGRAY
jgi:hypothetical protein